MVPRAFFIKELEAAPFAEKRFYDFINAIRIRKAKELLSDPKVKISDISELMGYADTAYFARTFKKLEEMRINEPLYLSLPPRTDSGRRGFIIPGKRSPVKLGCAFFVRSIYHFSLGFNGISQPWWLVWSRWWDLWPRGFSRYSA